MLTGVGPPVKCDDGRPVRHTITTSADHSGTERLVWTETVAVTVAVPVPVAE